MSVWSAGLLTKKGLDLHAKVEAGTTLLKITKMAVGSGVLEDDEDVQDLIALKHEELKVDISISYFLRIPNAFTGPRISPQNQDTLKTRTNTRADPNSRTN